ncbi:SMP-30/gluconolactonase/LRE family protein [Saccharopolyspora flava]|uniref:Sugar lactone lactonase YvrE n=1 Tax=Saccharopolyspora flava TaxID=95161 RepID=A0A1I6TM94_9PSEU|nr:SMP-30/gluconolactonase/LRE family protein [Saccharopolyspora flava]SFS90305.1 Sugar lactone lactonase YvrE [Saccharopolyspora flava]
MTEWNAWPGERFDLGEGVRVVDGRVVMVDILTGRLFELPNDGGPPQVIAEIAEPLGAVAPRPGGGWIAAAGTGIAVLGSEMRWLAELESNSGMRMNDGVADPAGRFWAGSMAYDNTPGAGTLYRVDPDGTTSVAVRGLTVPNGPAFSADGSTMYLADSAKGTVYRYRVDPSTGTLHDQHMFASLDHGSPDGMTVDAEGFLWSAIWGAGQVRRYAPDGSVDQVLDVPCAQPTSVCLTGDHLIVTSANIGIEVPTAFDGAVLAAPCTVVGTPTRFATCGNDPNTC